MEKKYDREYFVKCGSSWWLGLTEKEKEAKRKKNREASRKRWAKHKELKKTL